LEEIQAGQEITIALPETRDFVSRSAEVGILATIASHGFIMAIGPEDIAAPYECVSDVLLSTDVYRCFMAPFSTADYSGVIRFVNPGVTAAKLDVNGHVYFIPANHGVLISADACIRTLSAHLTSAQIVSLRPIPSTLINAEDFPLLPDHILPIRPHVPEPEKKPARRDRSGFTFTLDAGPSHCAVEVRPSLLAAGDGLFATDTIPVGNHITTYAGRLLHVSEWKQLTTDMKQYGAAVPNDSNYVVDGRVHFHGGLARFTNQGTESSANAAMCWVDMPQRRHDELPRGYISLVAKRDIFAGEEILMRYGAGHVYNNC
jgi:hypothetical protein